ncbi:Uncharacterised protein [Vibrio cholerae]|nr:Uncharacterised protein [Vibrio cholerae]CSI73625.1 Uncharacterised protein [Vibrio cholerae]
MYGEISTAETRVVSSNRSHSHLRMRHLIG